MAIRVSRQYTEALVTVDNASVRVSRQYVEALFVDNTPPGLKVSRQHIEALYLPLPDPELKVSRQRIELLFVDNTPPDLKVSRQKVEVLYPVRVFYGDGVSILDLQQVTNVETSLITFKNYGTIYEANEYFSKRLHEHAWTNSKPVDREKVLYAATLIIDDLNFKGAKHSDPQFLEFPRDDDTEVPVEIRLATYEVAQSLLDGKDPDEELENLGVTHLGMGSARTSYSKTQVPIEHIINGIPSPQAWRWLKPFLRDDAYIVLSRTC